MGLHICRTAVDPKKSTSAELLASLVALHLFGWLEGGKERKDYSEISVFMEEQITAHIKCLLKNHPPKMAFDGNQFAVVFIVVASKIELRSEVEGRGRER